MKNSLPIILITILFNISDASAQTWLWAKQSNVALKTDVFESNVATNRTGNVYQSGAYTTSVSFGSTTLTSQAVEDIFLVKYDENGNVLWAQTSTGTPSGFAIGYSVATDDSDNSYVEGFGTNSYQMVTDTISFGPYTLHLPEYGYFFLVKYDPNGNVQWAKMADTTVIPDGSYGYMVTTDKFKHEYVTGSGAFLLKYDRNGNIVWSVSNPSDFTDNVSGTGLATDASGNIFMSGYFYDTLLIGNNILYSLNEAQFVAKFDSNGNVLWVQQSNDNSEFSTYYNGFNTVATDGKGAVYLTGSYTDSIEFGKHLLTCIDSFTSTFFVVKFNPTGSVAWAEQAVALHNSSLNGWVTNSICSDDSNHIYFVGALRYNGTGSPFIFGNDTDNILDTDQYDAPTFLFKLDSTGRVLCNSTLTAGGIEPNAITADPTGEMVYVGGEFTDNFYIGNTFLSNTGGVYNCYVGRWQSCNYCNLVVNVSPTTIICSGNGAVLTASGGTNYTWSPSTGLNATTGSSVIANPTSNITYTVTTTDGGSCSVVSTIAVNLVPAPNIPVITVSVTGDSLISDANSYNQWYFDDNLLPNDTGRVLVIKGNQKGWYKVVVTNPANGCSTTSDSTTSINQLSVTSNQLSIYPNPTSSSVFVKINSAVSTINEWSLQLTDVLGRTVYAKSLLNYNNEIDLSNFAAGVYFITVVNKTGRAVFPVVKE